MICTRDLRHKVELEIQMASTSSKIKKSAPLSSTVVLPSLINKGCTHSFEINFINFDIPNGFLNYGDIKYGYVLYLSDISEVYLQRWSQKVIRKEYIMYIFRKI